MAVVEATDLVREYRLGEETVRALDGASLTIEGGQFVSVVGPSGAGKSTLLHVIGALDTPDSGRIVVDGVDLSTLGDDEASVTLHEERVNVTKETVPVEKVGLDKQTVRDTETVSEDVAHEEIEVDGGDRTLRDDKRDLR